MSTTIASLVVTPVITRALEERLVAQYGEVSVKILMRPASLDELLNAISLVVSEIEAGERIQVITPRSCSRHENSVLNSNHLDELHMRLRGYMLEPGVFVKLRFIGDHHNICVVDIVRV